MWDFSRIEWIVEFASRLGVVSRAMSDTEVQTVSDVLVTPAMLEAGLNAFWDSGFQIDNTVSARDAVKDIIRAALKAAPTAR